MRGIRESQLESKKLVLNLTNAIRTPPCGAELQALPLARARRRLLGFASCQRSRWPSASS